VCSFGRQLQKLVILDSGCDCWAIVGWLNPVVISRDDLDQTMDIATIQSRTIESQTTAFIFVRLKAWRSHGAFLKCPHYRAWEFIRREVALRVKIPSSFRYVQ
jgi:hypothetical protein